MISSFSYSDTEGADDVLYGILLSLCKAQV